jgi:hypothetical protein
MVNSYDIKSNVELFSIGEHEFSNGNPGQIHVFSGIEIVPNMSYAFLVFQTNRITPAGGTDSWPQTAYGISEILQSDLTTGPFEPIPAGAYFGNLATNSNLVYNFNTPYQMIGVLPTKQFLEITIITRTTIPFNGYMSTGTLFAIRGPQIVPGAS